MNPVGGGERVCLSVIEILKNMGHKVTLITTESTEWDRIMKIIGQVTKPDEEISVLPFKIRVFGIYMKFLPFLKLMRLKDKYDIIINTHGDILPVGSDIIYMHFPMFTIIKEMPINIKYSRSFFWRLYFYPYEKIQSYLVRKMKWKVLLTNSEFSKEAIKKYTGAEAIVLPPPVDVNEFLKVSNNKSRENMVILCGRYVPDKNYEFALRVAKELPDIEFTIIGAYSSKVSITYYLKLVRMREELNLKNVKLLVNIPRNEQLRIYSKAKVFMHTMVGEHFGIAVVEGMAAGLVPVVHESGGPWFDIIDQGKYGLGYKDVNTAVRAIEYALDNYEHLKEKAIKRAMEFNKENFLKKFKEIIENLKSEDLVHS